MKGRRQGSTPGHRPAAPTGVPGGIPVAVWMARSVDGEGPQTLAVTTFECVFDDLAPGEIRA